MVAFVETGDVRSLRADDYDDDKGRFTVQCTDVPLTALRRKPAKQTKPRKKVRLTPINEELDRERSFVSDHRAAEDGVMVSASTSPSGTSDSELDSYRRSATPVQRRPCIRKLLSDVADAYEEELENIPEDNDSKAKDPEIVHILRDLPPRPKCRMKVLPPSVTGEIGANKKTKLLKCRSRQSLHGVSSVSPVKEPDSKKSLLRDLNLANRPRSAESGVRVVRLSDLSSINSTSVPDLPSIISKMSKSRTDNFRAVTEFDESGALSTPRRSVEPLDSSCLKGHEISSFYNMWERDRKRRPFDKKEIKDEGLKVNRSCLCSIRQWGMKKCGVHTKRHFLPPLH